VGIANDIVSNLCFDEQDPPFCITLLNQHVISIQRILIIVSLPLHFLPNVRSFTGASSGERGWADQDDGANGANQHGFKVLQALAYAGVASSQ
jgi:hypothetical protein